MLISSCSRCSRSRRMPLLLPSMVHTQHCSKQQEVDASHASAHHHVQQTVNDVLKPCSDSLTLLKQQHMQGMHCNSAEELSKCIATCYGRGPAGQAGGPAGSAQAIITQQYCTDTAPAATLSTSCNSQPNWTAQAAQQQAHAGRDSRRSPQAS